MTCAVLHNLLLGCDGHDNWEYMVNDEDEDLDVAHETLEMLASKRMRNPCLAVDGGFVRGNRTSSDVHIDTSHEYADIVASARIENQ